MPLSKVNDMYIVTNTCSVRSIIIVTENSKTFKCSAGNL